MRLGGLLLFAVAMAIAFFFVLRLGGAPILESYLERSGFYEEYNERRIANLQSYIDKNSVSSKDSGKITKWVKKQPLILLEIYRSNYLLYTSYAPIETLDSEVEAPHYSWVSYYDVSFTDGNAEVVIYADDSYRFYMLMTVGALVCSVLLLLGIFLAGCQSLIRYICILNKEIQEMEGGNLDVSVTVKGKDELSELARSLDSMRNAFKEQKEHESEMYQKNQTMITQMSHDIRTPMTVLQLYTDILKYGRCEPDQVSGYLSKIDNKVVQIRQLADNLFDYSLASRNQPIDMGQPCSFRDAMHDILSESVAQLISQGFQFEDIPDWPAVKVCVYPPYLKRIMDNVVSNIIKYAAHDHKLRIGIGTDKDQAFLAFYNEISLSADKYMGTHIGISNIKTMMEVMGGECHIIQNDQEYRLTLYWPIFVWEDEEDHV